MAHLLDTAIERELTANERRVIYAHYFENKSCPEIAREFSLTASTVRETKKRAERKLKKALGYLYMYMTDMVTQPDFDLCLNNSFSIIASEKSDPPQVGGRLKKLRTGRALSREKASAALGITKERIRKMEEGSAIPDAHEIRRICRTFGVSYEALLDGAN